MPRSNRDFENHVSNRRVGPPKTLYKYFKAEIAKTVLTNGRLRHQSPLEYNDPFDSQWDGLWFVKTPRYVAKERAVLAHAIRNRSAWPVDMDTDLRAALDGVVARIDKFPEEEREHQREIFLTASTGVLERSEKVIPLLTDLRRRLRVLCLCENDLSILMWAHYADQHQGVLLGFDTQKCEQELSVPLEKVTYACMFPTIVDEDAWAHRAIFGTPKLAPESVDYRALTLTKSRHWEYETEWRFVSVDRKGTIGSFDDLPFPPESLVEIRFGLRTRSTDLEELTRLAKLRNPNVIVTTVKSHPTRFELEKRVQNVSCNSRADGVHEI